MRYGNYSGINLIYSPFFTVGVLLLAIFVFFLIFIEPKRKRSEHERILDILAVRYAKNEIDEDKYYEVKSILENEESDSPAIMVLKERYACGNLSSDEFIKMRDNIN